LHEEWLGAAAVAVVIDAFFYCEVQDATLDDGITG
jgi:hypothetical protein